MTEMKKLGGWASKNGKTFYPHIASVQPKLEPGYYRPFYQSGIYMLEKIEIADRNLLRFPDSNTDLIMKDIETFWTKEELFKKYKFPYKRGILMYGKPGCGKSGCVTQVVTDVISRNGVVIKYENAEYFLAGMELLRSLEPEIPVVVLMEDLDKILYSDDSSTMLNILDGVGDHVNKVVFLATTNEINSLAENIRNRPSRFDRRFKFDPPSLDTRKRYFHYLFKSEAFEGNERIPTLDVWAKETDGFSFAHMKELFVSVVLLDSEFTTTLAELKIMQSKVLDDNSSSIDDESSSIVHMDDGTKPDIDEEP